MAGDFHQQTWDDALAEDLRWLLRLGVMEDVARGHDWTTLCLVPMDAQGEAKIVARKPGVAVGLLAGRQALQHFSVDASFEALVADGDTVQPGDPLAVMKGPARALLTAERTILNLMGHMSGIATATRAYVELVSGTKASIYDTRKTMPGYRRLDKYAVRAGGGCNHRLGLNDAILIKDNHLAFGGGAGRFTPAEAVRKARAFCERLRDEPSSEDTSTMPHVIEVEVDNIEQLREVLPAAPDIVLLDNMKPEQLRECVALRDAVSPQVILEASGGVTLDTVRAIAESGVDRISVGALTHSVTWWDVGLDWR